MAYRIRHCRWESGERYCMLVDAQTGIPARQSSVNQHRIGEHVGRGRKK